MRRLLMTAAGLAACSSAYGLPMPYSGLTPRGPITSTDLLGVQPVGYLGTKSVKATALAAFTGVFQGVVSPVDPAYGCIGDGVTDDSLCFAAALVASSGKTLNLGPHKYKLVTAPASISYPVHIVGVLPGYDSTFPNDVSEIIAGSTNMGMLNLVSGSSGSILENFAMKMGAAGANTLGSAVTLGSVSQVTVSNLWINKACVGLDVNGNTNVIQNTIVDQVRGAGCGGVRVGHSSTGAGTVDVSLVNVTSQGDNSVAGTTNPDFNLRVEDAGGLSLFNFNGLYGVQGTVIQPGANQDVIWLFADNSALGDTTRTQALVINTGAASAVIKGLQFHGTWTASNVASDGVQIANTSSGSVTDIYFDAHRFYNSFGSGVAISSGVTNVSIDASHVCGFGVYGVSLLSGATKARIRNSDISPTCAGLSGSGTTGINLAGSNSSITITGNDFTGSTTTVGGAPTLVSSIGSNTGVDNLQVTAASASTLALSTVAPTYLITGTTGVLNITGGWYGRTVRLITTDGAVTFSTGGSAGSSIAKNFTSVQNVPITAWYDSSQWFLK